MEKPKQVNVWFATVPKKAEAEFTTQPRIDSRSAGPFQAVFSWGSGLPETTVRMKSFAASMS